MAKAVNQKIWGLAIRSDGQRYSAPPVAPPTAISRTVNSATQITLQASGGSSTLGTNAGYRYRRNGQVLNATATASPYVDSGLTAATQYSYTATLVDSSGNESELSAAFTATTNSNADTTPPSAPVISAQAISQNSIRVSLVTPSTDAGAGLRDYTLETSITSSGPWTPLQTAVQAAIFPYTHAGLAASTLRFYRLVAFDQVGNSVASSVVSATTQSSGNSVHVGYDNAGQAMTADTMIIDASRDLQSEGFRGIWANGAGYPGLVSPAQVIYQPNGGFGGVGCNLFIPAVINSQGEHYCGFGQFHNINSPIVNVGMLLKFGTGFWGAQPSDIKLLIMLRGGMTRPMIISKRGNSTRVLGACDGTVCNTRSSQSPVDFHNDGNNQPNIETVTNRWVWVSFRMNCNNGTLQTHIWDELGTFNGTQAVNMTMAQLGGQITDLDIMGFMNGITNQVAANGYAVQRLEIRRGVDGILTPPAGFPGSNR